MNPLKSLHQQGQSFWLDYISRNLIQSGQLKRLVEEDGLRGLTSNPTIFQKSIAGSSDYDTAINQVLQTTPNADENFLFERLAIEDIQAAADVLRPIYDESTGDDGYVSLEVSPRLAYDTDGTVVAALDFWRAVARPNVMIKVPATPEGIPAIEVLIAEGVNINVTLLFSLKQYQAVANAYIRGLGLTSRPERVRSVASFFISRVDTAIDKALSAINTEEALSLKGEAAIANAKLAYQCYLDIFQGEAFAQLAKRGAKPQRLLWGSTAVKNPAYRDVLYIEELIGPDTVNTMPLETANLFKDHGQAEPRLTRDIEAARTTIKQLAKLGIDLDTCGDQLQREGVKLFQDSFDQLLAALKEKLLQRR